MSFATTTTLQDFVRQNHTELVAHKHNTSRMPGTSYQADIKGKRLNKPQLNFSQYLKDTKGLEEVSVAWGYEAPDNYWYL